MDFHWELAAVTSSGEDPDRSTLRPDLRRFAIAHSEGLVHLLEALGDEPTGRLAPELCIDPPQEPLGLAIERHRAAPWSTTTMASRAASSICRNRLSCMPGVVHGLPDLRVTKAGTIIPKRIGKINPANCPSSAGCGCAARFGEEPWAMQRAFCARHRPSRNACCPRRRDSGGMRKKKRDPRGSL